MRVMCMWVITYPYVTTWNRKCVQWFLQWWIVSLLLFSQSSVAHCLDSRSNYDKFRFYFLSPIPRSVVPTAQPWGNKKKSRRWMLGLLIYFLVSRICSLSLAPCVCVATGLDSCAPLHSQSTLCNPLFFFFFSFFEKRRRRKRRKEN